MNLEDINLNMEIDTSEVCRQAFELMAAKNFEDAEKLINNNLSKVDDDVSIALYHSVLGVLFKMKGEFKEAWRHYQRAEKLLPNDPALKIISARLLIEQFAEYSQAIKKAKKVLDLMRGNPVFAHQAYTTMGIAYAREGKKNDAVEMFTKSIGSGFDGFITAQNIDMSLLEVLLRKGWGIKECGDFIASALAFSNFTKEEKFIDLFQKLMATYSKEYHSTQQN